jgi:LPXTG-motif cell wall-anchored protein
VTQDFGGLAATGSDVTPWLIIAGIVVLLGVIALVVAGVIRSRRAERRVEDAAAVVAGAGGVLPEPDANAPESAETVIQEASELGATDAGALGTEGSTPPAGGSEPAAPGDGQAPGDAPKD